MRALRLNPPEVAFSPELLWVLARAFGPAGRPFEGAFDAALAARLSAKLDLASRIGAVTPEALLVAEAGEEAASFRRAALTVTASNLYRMQAARVVADLAARAGIRLAVLKGLAFEALDLAPAGARATSDLDLLVPRARIPDLERLLASEGWVTAESLELEQHVDPLVHPRHGMAEIHSVLLGVRLPGTRRSVDFDALDAAGLLGPAPGLPSNVFAPSRPVLLAHSLVHGLVQHGSAPASYPAFRVLADVADLGPSAERLAEAGTYLRELDAEDLAAIGELVRALASGRPPAPPGASQSVEGRPDPTLVLLRHLVAGATDRAYAEGLRSSEGFLVPLSDLPAPLTAVRSAWRAVVLSRAQIDHIYGPPRGRLGYAARRLARPFDLVVRWLRYSAARRRARGRTP